MGRRECQEHCVILEWSGKANWYTDTWGNVIPGKGHSKCKVSEVAPCLLVMYQGASKTGEEKVGGQTARDKVRDVARGQLTWSLTALL